MIHARMDLGVDNGARHIRLTNSRAVWGNTVADFRDGGSKDYSRQIHIEFDRDYLPESPFDQRVSPHRTKVRRWPVGGV